MSNWGNLNNANNIKKSQIFGCLLAISWSCFSFNVFATKPHLQHYLTKLNGSSVLLSDMVTSDKPIYLKFWASWCQPCLKEMPHLQHSWEAFAQDVQIIAVNIDINETNEDINAVVQKFGLTVPILKDSSGSLAKSMHFLGTPYHIFIDESGEIVHKGHQANDILDRKLRLLAQGEEKLQSVALVSQSQEQSVLDLNDGQIHALYFTATWCDWYFKETRPDMSEACIAAQYKVNKLAQNNGFSWQVITSHLWTGTDQIAKYRRKYDIDIPVKIDPKGDAFFKFKVKKIPTLLLVKHGKIMAQSAQVSEFTALVANYTQ